MRERITLRAQVHGEVDRVTRIEAEERVDGRKARAERTRKAIVEAHITLLYEGDLKPTGERIAERAGVSVRTVWTTFRDQETLFGATAEEVLRRQDTGFKPVSTELDLTARLEAFCRQRARNLETVAPAARAARLMEPFSPQLRRSRSSHISRVRAELRDLFAEELGQAGADRDRLLHAMTVATTFSTWSMLRDELRLGAAEARRIMLLTLRSLLPADSGRSTRSG
jgi:TetR/AcrR family transcriptional regulator, regulator of autoinduction and epiphytic fitness